jgi:hypothetical protein
MVIEGAEGVKISSEPDFQAATDGAASKIVSLAPVLSPVEDFPGLRVTVRRSSRSLFKRVSESWK